VRAQNNNDGAKKQVEKNPRKSVHGEGQKIPDMALQRVAFGTRQ
jgi:hypothetical protein